VDVTDAQCPELATDEEGPLPELASLVEVATRLPDLTE